MKHLNILFYSFILLLLLPGCTDKAVQSPALIEIIDTDYHFSTQDLVKFSKDNNLDYSSIFEWQNHWVIYCDLNRATNYKQKLETLFPSIIVKLYDTPFYNFNRRQYSDEKPAAKWHHIIMTANMVEDTLKQKEYLEYHRTQKEKWPEISKGFYNANFQQVLVFHNGRQLMLVISIPEGESLDRLNPKTTENNPRVTEWNSIMGNYQEGIEDAPKGTTWVMFSTLKGLK